MTTALAYATRKAQASPEVPDEDDVEWKASPGAVLEASDDGLLRVIVSVTGVVDEVMDNILPGAYAATLAQRVPKGVWAHDWKVWCSRTENVEEWMPGDPRLPAEWKRQPWPASAGALVVDTRYNLDTDAGRDAYSNVRFFNEGPIPDQVEYSIGYRVPPGGSTKTSRGVREIKTLLLFEYSPVLFGAMPLAGVMATDQRKAAVDDEGSLETTDGSTLHVELKLAGREVTPKDVKDTHQLTSYWAHGEGAAKIRWGVAGDFDRCRVLVGPHLPNPDELAGFCFAGETEIVTRDGVVRLADVAGTEQMVLTQRRHGDSPGRRDGRVVDSDAARFDGRWVQAPIRSFGEQRLLSVTMNRFGETRVVRATPEHLWFASVDGRTSRRLYVRETSTAELHPGMVLASLHPMPNPASAVRWTVVSVEDHGEAEEVFCATVPDTETFALAGNVWVHNCANRHHEATGAWPGHAPTEQVPGHGGGDHGHKEFPMGDTTSTADIVDDDPEDELALPLDAPEGYPTGDAEVDVEGKAEGSMKCGKSAKDCPHTMSDDSYPIHDADETGKAVQAYPRGAGKGGKSKADIRKHVMTRAKAVKATSKVPNTWPEKHAGSEKKDAGEVEGKTYPSLAGSIEEVQDKIRVAANDALLPDPDPDGDGDGPRAYVSIEGTFPDHAIITVRDYSVSPTDQHTYSVPYTYDDDGDIELGAPTEVQLVATAVPAAVGGGTDDSMGVADPVVPSPAAVAQKVLADATQLAEQVKSGVPGNAATLLAAADTLETALAGYGGKAAVIPGLEQKDIGSDVDDALAAFEAAGVA